VYSYSNPGYWLAGFAGECAAGKPFADAMAELVFAPLGMKRTTFRPTLAMTFPLAVGHAARNGTAEIIRPAADNAATWPAGSMYTSAHDAARFLIAALHGGKIDGHAALSVPLLKTITTPFVSVPGRGHYGYGLHIERYRGVELISHTGSREGHGSRIVLAPSQGFGLAILANRTGASLPRTGEAALELALTLDPPAKPAEPAKPTPAELTSLIGTYRHAEAVMELKWAGGKLLLSDGKQVSAVVPLGNGRFRAEGGSFAAVTGLDGKTSYLFRSARAFRKETAQ
jgi:CubicO group peptidase (beta-lactamase class C family)